MHRVHISQYLDTCLRAWCCSIVRADQLSCCVSLSDPPRVSLCCAHTDLSRQKLSCLQSWNASCGTSPLNFDLIEMFGSKCNISQYPLIYSHLRFFLFVFLHSNIYSFSHFTVLQKLCSENIGISSIIDTSYFLHGLKWGVEQLRW